MCRNLVCKASNVWGRCLPTSLREKKRKQLRGEPPPAASTPVSKTISQPGARTLEKRIPDPAHSFPRTMGPVNRGRSCSSALPTEGGLAPRPQARTPIRQAHLSLEQCEADAGQAPPSRCSPVRRDSGGAALDPGGSGMSVSLLCLLLVGVLQGRGRRKERTYRW